MGKGKKKDTKKVAPVAAPEELPISSLTISGAEPSTSQASIAAVEEDVGGLGLTGGSSKKNPTSAVQTPQVEEEEGLGLGLGEGRKRNPRKKKKDREAAAVVAATAAKPDISSVTQPKDAVVTPAPPSETDTQLPPKPWSQGSSAPAPRSGVGRGRGRVQPPITFGGQQAQTQPGSESIRQPLQVAGDGAQHTPPQAQPVTQSTSHQPDKKRTETKNPMPLCRYQIPAKIIGKTVRARDVEVLTNYLRMTIQPIQIYRYDVAFNPDKPKKFIPLAFKAAKNIHFPADYIAFDLTRNCYSLKPLSKVPQNDRFVTSVPILDVNGRTITFELAFKATGVVDLKTILHYMQSGGSSLAPPTEAIQAVDVILRQGTLESYVKAGRMFFKRPSRPIDLGAGLEMWTGLFQSAIFTSAAFVNVDVAHKGFPKHQRLTDTIDSDFRLDLNRPLEEQGQNYRSVDLFKVFMKNLRVTTDIIKDDGTKMKREFICNEPVGPPHSLFFCHTSPDGKEQRMSVADYYGRVKKYKLRYPNFNCIWVGPRDKNIFYPVELLEVTYGQALNKQLNENQLANMVREAATPPDERKRKIEEVISNMNYSKNEYFKKFGLQIENNFFPVVAKVLQAPSLDVGERQPIVPRNGSWQARRLLKPEALQSWAFIAVEPVPNSCDFDNIIQMIMQTGQQMGMKVERPKLSPLNVKMDDLFNTLTVALRKEVKFLFVIVSTRGRDYYHKVKKMAERDVGILTQCIKENTAARRMNGQTVRNILLKVNSKLMGINQALDNSSMPKCLVGGGVMIVGADVTHPSPEQTCVPSIAAVTASIDPKCYSYNIELSIQTPKKEMIVQFEDMMVDHLKVYKARQGSLPKKIYVFRDGVSEGQFAQVLNSELTGVHAAYRRMSGSDVKPEVLFLLVQKRHHTRLFDSKNHRNNVEPGTVVDTHIVHARELDFYLVSHQAIKGTARPTRYHAVCNDGRIPADEVEQLTYYLCHLYSRCMRAVSYPTPTYYAHLACLRARSLTYGEQFNNADLEKNPKRLNVLKKMLDQSRMFFV